LRRLPDAPQFLIPRKELNHQNENIIFHASRAFNSRPDQ
jgi:hypothetical protein